MASKNAVGPDRRRKGLLALLSAVLILGGLVLAATAPAGPTVNNKLDAYGGPTVAKPVNPKSKAECDKYYGGAVNQLSEVRGCRATAAYNIAVKACAKKSGAKKAKCVKAAKRVRAAARAKVAKQAKAEKACGAAYNETTAALQQQQQALDPNAPDYVTQSSAIDALYQQASDADVACIKKAQH